MALSTGLKNTTNTWTKIADNSTFDFASTQLQLLLFNIFQVLEPNCNISQALEGDFQEAVRLVSVLKILGVELEEKLLNYEQDFREGLKSTQLTTFKKQLQITETQLKTMTEEKKYLQDFINNKETALAAEKTAKQKLARLVETLQHELSVTRRENDEMSNEIYKLKQYELQRNLDEQKAMQELLREVKVMKLGMKMCILKEQLLKQYIDENRRLHNLTRSLEHQRTIVTEKNMFLGTTLNSMILNNSDLTEKLQNIKQQNEHLLIMWQNLRENLKGGSFLANATKQRRTICPNVQMNSFSDKIHRLSSVIRAHDLRISSRLMEQFGNYRETEGHTMREVLKGRTREKALSEAAQIDEIDTVLVLLKHNVDPNKFDVEGMAPLHWSAFKGNLKITEALLRHRHIDLEKRAIGRGQATSLHLATAAGHVQIAELLLDLGADVNARAQDGSTALHLASKEGHILMVKTLLARGANPKLTNVERKTPKDLAIAKRHFRIVEILS